MKREGGFALVITLIITALLVAIATEFATEVYVETSARRNFIDDQQASLLAESGVAGGVKILQLTLGRQSFSSLLDKWATPIRLENEKGTIQITIEEETGKLNLNYVAPSNGELDNNNFYYGVATRLFKKLGMSADLCDSLADWVDTNDVPHPGGAETSYYQTLKPPYEAKNNKLETLEELILVKGFGGDNLTRLAPLVTVYPDEPFSPAAPINVNTAPKEILAALDEKMTDSLVERILDYRKTTPFKLAPDLGKVTGMEGIYQGLIGKVTTKGGVFRIHSQAWIGETSRTIEAVVRLGSPPKKLYWREF